MKYRFVLPVIMLVKVVLAQGQHDLRGLKWEDSVYHAQPVQLNYGRLVGDEPPVFSLKKFCPKVINTGSTNTAVATAAVWYGRTMLENLTCGHKESSQHAYNGFFNNRLISPSCDEVLSLTAVLQSLQQTGAVKYERLKTFCLDSITPDLLPEAAAHRISGFVRLFNTFDNKSIKVNAIKAALHAGNPVILGIIAPGSFSRAPEFWQPKESPDLGTAGHAVAVVGYDDRNYGGAFEVVNSWGKHWGKDGFTWIRYEDVESFIRYGYAMFDNQYSACVNKSASARVRFTQTNGMEMTASSARSGFFRLDKTYPTKTEFTVKVSTEQKMWVYGVYTDPSNAVMPFFPWPEKHDANAIIFSKYEFSLPPGDFPFTLEPPAGTNYLCFIFSSSPLDVQAMSKQLQSGAGDFATRVRNAFKIRNGGQTMQWKDGMNFTVEYDNEFRVAMIVQLDQK